MSILSNLKSNLPQLILASLVQRRVHVLTVNCVNPEKMNLQFEQLAVSAATTARDPLESPDALNDEPASVQLLGVE